MADIPLMEVNVTGLGREPSGVADVSGLADGIDAVVRRGIHAVGLSEGGRVVAAIVPIEDVHESHGCCCGYCPWGGVHPGPHLREAVRLECGHVVPSAQLDTVQPLTDGAKVLCPECRVTMRIAGRAGQVR